jgi:hypothetical protein
LPDYARESERPGSSCSAATNDLYISVGNRQSENRTYGFRRRSRCRRVPVVLISMSSLKNVVRSLVFRRK